MFRHRPLRFVAGLVAFVGPGGARPSPPRAPSATRSATSGPRPRRSPTASRRSRRRPRSWPSSTTTPASPSPRSRPRSLPPRPGWPTPARQLGKRKADVASYAVNAYMLGDPGGSAAEMLDAEDGNEVGRRKGYASAAIGDREDLLDACGSRRPRRRPTPPPSARPRRPRPTRRPRSTRSARPPRPRSTSSRRSSTGSRASSPGWSPPSSAAVPRPPPGKAREAARRAAAEAAREPGRRRAGRAVGRRTVEPAVHAGPRRRPAGRPGRRGGDRRGSQRPRRALHVGRRRPEHRLRLLRARDVGLGPRRQVAPALVGRDVRLVPAHLDVVDPARRPHLLRQPGPPRRASTSAAARSSTPRTPAPTCRSRASTTGATSPEPDGSSWAAPAAGAVRS